MTLRALLLACLCCCTGAQAGMLEAQGFEQVQRSAASGDPAAAYDLGRMYRNGIGTRPDGQRAFEWIQVAARRDHPAAMFILSNMLMEGEGTARDEAGARRWLEAAAELDCPEALQQLALHLQDGAMGFARDPERSAHLMREMAHAMRHRPAVE